jgi:hypothetical protein
MLFEESSLLLLVLHAIAGMACVALSTHLFLWLRRYFRGRASHSAVRRFALWTLVAYGLTMVLGLALYPTYRTQVRAAYFDNPSAIQSQAKETAQAQANARARSHESLRFRRGEVAARSESEQQVSVSDIDLVKKVEWGARLSRWFDVKEHWAMVGLLLSLAILGMLATTRTSRDNKPVAGVIVGMALIATLGAWSSAIIGIVCTAARSVGAL